MMYNMKTTEFGGFDLLGALGVTTASTVMACQNASLRYGVAVGEKKEVQIYTDTRFLAGVAGVVASQLGSPTIGRVGMDVATGMLSSLASTETCRYMASRKQQTEVASVAPAAAPAQIPQQAAAAPARARAGTKNTYGSMNYAW